MAGEMSPKIKFNSRARRSARVPHSIPPPMRDRTFGALALAALTLAFVYYTLWLLVVPLVDDGHPALALFPRPELAVALSAHLGAGVVCLSVFIVGAAMIVHRPRKGEKRA